MSESAAGAALRRYVRLVAAYVATGAIVGVVWFGIVGRLAMRLLALTSSAAVQGAFTDAGEEIGVVSLSGTLALFVFGGLGFGVLGGLLYGLIRPVLPTRAAVRLATCAVVGIVVALAAVIDADGRDPRLLLEPTWLAVALFVVLGAGGGVALSLVAERLRPFYLDTPLAFPRMLAFLPLIVLVVPLVAIPVVVVGIVSVLARNVDPPPWVHTAGRLAAAALLVVVGIMGIAQLGEIEVRSPRSSDFVSPFSD